MDNNLKLWDSVKTTDPAYTKAFSSGGYKGTAIAPQWLFMRATEIFGPIGKGWGYEIIKSEIVSGGPMMGKDANGNHIDLGPTQIHTAQVTFWYVEKGERLEVTGIGHTPFVYLTQNGPKTDMEYEKKSVTDAITKAMSYIGFGADVRLGMFEDPMYLDEINNELSMEKATDKNMEALRQREEFLTSYEKTMELMSTAVSINELTKLYNSILAMVEKKGKGDELHNFKNLFSEKVREFNKPREVSNG